MAGTVCYHTHLLSVTIYVHVKFFTHTHIHVHYMLTHTELVVEMYNKYFTQTHIGTVKVNNYDLMHDYSVHYKSCLNTFSGVTLVHVTQMEKWIGMPLIKGVNDAAIIAMQANYYYVERVLNLGSAYPGCQGVPPPPFST